MKKFKLSIPIMMLFMAFMISCEDFNTNLDVANTENPDDKILASDPVALTATSTGLIRSWFMTVHSTRSPFAAMAVMSDATSCSWGNFGMRDLSSEPRVAFNNTTAYGNNVTSSYFNSLYSILSDSNTLALAVKNGTEFEEPKKVEFLANLGQSLTIGYLALAFDQVWLSDEDGAVQGSGLEGASTYQEAMTFALGKLDKAIALAKANNISLGDDIIPGGNGNNAKLVQFLNSMGARMMVGNVRNTAQKSQLDWNKVLNYANAGLTSDFEIYMDDTSWYDLIPKTYLVYPGWARADMYTVNLMDPTNQPQVWPANATTVAQSTTPADARLNSDYQYLASNNFRPERGTYHYSNYRYSRLNNYITVWTTNVTEFSASENDMYKAEAMAFKSGADLAGAAAVINAGTRVTRGILPPVSPNLEEIKKAIHHERFVEFAYTGVGLTFFEMRKENLLQKGTLLHFPVPGAALESIPAPYYTFGGDQGVPGEDVSNGGWK